MEYSKTGDENYLIDAAIYAGVYYAFGGRVDFGIGTGYLIITVAMTIVTEIKRMLTMDLDYNFYVIRQCIFNRSGGLIETTFNRNHNGIVLTMHSSDNSLRREGHIIINTYIDDADLTKIAIQYLKMFGLDEITTKRTEKQINNILGKVIL